MMKRINLEERLKQMGITPEMWSRLLEAIADDVAKMSDAEIEEMMKMTVAEKCAMIRRAETIVQEAEEKDHE